MKDIMKKIRLYIIAITTLLFVFSGSLLAQTSTIEGYVKDGSGRTAVPGINMYILNPAMTTTTDISGHYSFNGISSGTTITVSCYVMGPSLPGSIRTFVVAPGRNIVDFWLHAVSDADGNFYSAVDIGSQIWMGENLKTTRDKYGNPIPNITDNTIWHNLRSPGYCWYNNDATSYKDTYGAIYNGYAADTGNICPSGWHVPINADWLTLQASVGGVYIGGGNLKSTGTIEGGDGLWHNPNTGATNEFGFTALPGGERSHSDGSFLDLGYQAGFWVNYSGLGPDTLVNFAAHYNNVATGWIWTFEYEGYSVRCLNDILKATLITTTPVSITVNSAQSGGNITLDGGASVTDRGVCWSTSHNPTIADNLTSNGSGIGIFTSSLTGLTPNTLYYVRAYATNSMGTAYGDEISFTTLSCPTITATISGTTSICQNAVSPNITFTGSGGTAPYTFTYLINSGTNLTVTTSVANSVTVAAPTGAAGTFTYYLLSAYDSRGSSCSQAQSGSAVVTVNPVPFITAMTATVCSGAGFTVTPVNITNGIVPAGTTYSWPAPVVTGGMTGGAAGTAAANISGTLTNPTNTAQTATYTITPTSGGCTGATFTVTVTVNPQPTITGNLNVCLGSTTQLTGSGTAAASTPWVSATPGVATVSPTGLVTSVSAGTSVITYTNNNGCSITATVMVNALPTISGTLSVCLGSTTQLTGSGTPAASTPWVSATPGVATVNNSGLVTSVSAGTSVITYTNNNGCSITATVTVNALPTITGTLSVCLGSTTQLTGSGTPAASTPWVSATPGVATVNNSGLVTSVSAGTSVITYTNNNGCSITATVTVNPLPTGPVIGTITNPTCSVATGSVILNGLPSTGSWTLTTNPGGTTYVGNVTSFTITGLAAGSYTYTVTNASGCTSPASGNVVINTQPVTPTVPAVGMITQPTCTLATGSVVLSGLPAGNWTINPGAIAGTGASTTINGLAANTYNFAVTNASGCTSPASGNVIINVQPVTPTATASANGPLIPGAPLSLTGGPGGMTTYAWTGPNGFISALQNPVVSASATTDMAGVYTLTVTNSSGCQSSATTIVASNPLIVTNVNDNGIGSLRYAMNYANSTVGTDIITFSIPGYGPFTIQPHTALPKITDPVIIDGYSQPGASATSPILLIEIDGTNAGTGSNGLIISGGSCTAKGLVINRFAGD